jgi:hypothetical protein
MDYRHFTPSATPDELKRRTTVAEIEHHKLTKNPKATAKEIAAAEAKVLAAQAREPQPETLEEQVEKRLRHQIAVQQATDKAIKKLTDEGLIAPVDAPKIDSVSEGLASENTI